MINIDEFVKTRIHQRSEVGGQRSEIGARIYVCQFMIVD